MSFELVLKSQWSSSDNRKRHAIRAAHEGDVATLCDLLEFYLRLKSKNRNDISEETLRKYKYAVKRFVAFLHPENGTRRELTRLEADDLDFWAVAMQHEALKPNAIALYLNGVRALFRALIWAKATDRNPALEVKAPKDATPAHAKKQALSPALYRELLALPAAQHDQDPRRERDVLLLALGGSGGLRAKEIVGLDVGDVDLPLQRLTVRQGKGGKSRIVPLSKSLLGIIKAWLQTRKALELDGTVAHNETALLVSVSRNDSQGTRLTTDGARFVAKGYYMTLGLSPELWGLHTLRRTAGTHLYRATRDLHVVADVLGHASVTTSAIYAKMDMDVRREALEAMEALRDKTE